MAGSYPVYGIVYDTDGTTPLASVTVTARNESTNKTISETTNTSGQYVLDLGNLTGSWNNGDNITVYLKYQSAEKVVTFTIDTSTYPGGYEQDLTLVTISVAQVKLFTAQNFLDFFELKTYETDAENGIKIDKLILTGQMAEKEIEEDCNYTFDDNDGSYYTQTDYFDDVADYRVFTPTKRPIYSITSLNYNVNRDGAADSWDTTGLTENTDYTKNPITDQIKISSGTSKMPSDDRPRGWKLVYTYGRTVPADIKLLAMFDTAIKVGLGTLVKSKIGGHKSEAQDFMSWYAEYRLKVINRYRNQAFVNT